MNRFCLIIFILLSVVACSKQHRVTIIKKSNSSIYRELASINLDEKFSVVKNDGETLIVKVGDFKTAVGKLKCTVQFNDKVIYESSSIGPGDLLQLNIIESGIYSFDITRKIYTPRTYARVEALWEQDVFVQAESDFTVSHEEIAKIAQKYSPIISMHHREKYLPSSLEYIFNLEGQDKELGKEKFILETKRSRLGNNLKKSSIKFSFNDLAEAISKFGVRDGLINIGHIQKISSKIRRRYGRPEYTTLYYCYFEKDRKLHIRYYTLYSFDPKNVLFNPAVTHIFDRESFSVIYDLDEKVPDYLVYSSHLINQTIGIGDENKENFSKWEGGKLYLEWEEVPKHNGRPVVAVAEGSHAIYPIPGNYGVFIMHGIGRLIEEAGGGKTVIVPRGRQYKQDSDLRVYGYKLKNLDIGRITSNSWNRMLGFSGNMIDLFSFPLISDNLYFPPFAERDRNVFEYNAKENTHHMDMSLVPKASWNYVKRLQKELVELPSR